MKTLCKQKNNKHRCKERNLKRFELIATHQCAKCNLLACSKKALCKAKKIV